MSDTVIKVENISKQYRLGNVGLGTISHDLNRWYQTTVRRREDPYLKVGEENNRALKGESEYVWALRDINFEVKQGEVLGIIGRNGAGKSTLLKILSRTTSPTTGQIKIKGRVASLLEVGTGFHPELTGRENIFLNGAILGMTKKEIKSKFDEMVDFAGVERYIDTPVKRYSSGMYVRLAFAVAAHLEPEILIVDEVLAVGDAEFQKKALGKMKDVSRNGGRTVLFVSHNMASIKSLCTNGLFLKDGMINAHGEIMQIMEAYHNDVIKRQERIHVSFYANKVKTECKFDILEVSVTDKQNTGNGIFTTNDDLVVSVKYVLRTNLKAGVINFSVENQEQVIFLTFDTDLNISALDERISGVYEAKINIPSMRLKPGIYSISFNTGIANVETYLRLEKCLVFEIVLDYENETFISYSKRREGIVAMPLLWDTNKINDLYV